MEVVNPETLTWLTILTATVLMVASVFILWLVGSATVLVSHCRKYMKIKTKMAAAQFEALKKNGHAG